MSFIVSTSVLNPQSARGLNPCRTLGKRVKLARSKALHRVPTVFQRIENCDIDRAKLRDIDILTALKVRRFPNIAIWVPVSLQLPPPPEGFSGLMLAPQALAIASRKPCGTLLIID